MGLMFGDAWQRGCLMSPTEHFYRAARYGFIAFLAAGALVAVVFFTRGPDGQVHLVAWASLLRDGGLSSGVAHFLLWTVAMVFMGCCGGGTAWAFCHCIPARCPRCGGAAYWRAAGSWAYRCRECKYLDETGLPLTYTCTVNGNQVCTLTCIKPKSRSSK